MMRSTPASGAFEIRYTGSTASRRGVTVGRPARPWVKPTYWGEIPWFHQLVSSSSARPSARGIALCNAVWVEGYFVSSILDASRHHEDMNHDWVLAVASFH